MTAKSLRIQSSFKVCKRSNNVCFANEVELVLKAHQMQVERFDLLFNSLSGI